MFFHPKDLKSENNNPWFKPWCNILLHTQSIVCATIDSLCLEYILNLGKIQNHVSENGSTVELGKKNLFGHRNIVH